MESKVKSMLIILFDIKGLFTKNSFWQAKQSLSDDLFLSMGLE
jgi:hypothetical protein